MLSCLRCLGFKIFIANMYAVSVVQMTNKTLENFETFVSSLDRFSGRKEHLRKRFLCRLRLIICNISICCSILMSSNSKYSRSTPVTIVYCCIL